MSAMSLPYVCIELDAQIPARTRDIHSKLQSGTRESQAKAAADTLGLAINVMVDRFLSQLLRDLGQAHPEYSLYPQALKVVDDIQGKVAHYLNWLTRFLSNSRMSVVTGHYLALMKPLVPDSPSREFLAVSLPPDMAIKARQTINALRDGSSKDVAVGIEVLVEIVDAVLVDFVYEPKRLMRFNAVVDKTLDGVIYMIKGLAFRQLRQLGQHLPIEHVPIFLDHLERFFRDQESIH